MTDRFLCKEIESRQPAERNTVDKEKTRPGNTCAIEVKHSSKGNKSLSESGNCCHFAINGGIKISKYFVCRHLEHTIKSTHKVFQNSEG
jgi:hypothetical protein